LISRYTPEKWINKHAGWITGENRMNLNVDPAKMAGELVEEGFH